METAHLSISELCNLLSGIFSFTAGVLVLVHRKNYTLYKGVTILLFALGVSACANIWLPADIESSWVKPYFFSKSIIPIFLLLFSEYLLKINYHIIVKLVVLTVTWILGFGSLLIQGNAPVWYQLSMESFLIFSLFLILIHVAHGLSITREKILIKYLVIFLLTISLALINIGLVELGFPAFQNFSDAIFSFIITHGVILVITSGGHSRLNQKLFKLFFILAFGLLVGFVFAFHNAEVAFQNQLALFVICTGILSLYYEVTETSKNLKEMGSAKLITRLLGLNLKDQHDFLRQLTKWEEISGLYPVKATEVEGNLNQLTALFQQAGQVIHKFQMTTLAKALAHDPKLRSGLDVAKYYFIKFDCDSLFQLSDKGDFLSVKYTAGLNPALHSNEILIMSKIIYSAGFNKN